MIEPGRVGSWQKISVLGSGAFGIVTLWKDTNTDDFIAVKKCKFQTTTSLTAKQKERWKNEVDIMKIINHPNIIQFRAMPSILEKALLEKNPTGLPLLSMEYCRNGNLRRLLSKPKNVAGLEEQDVRCVLQDISGGLQHLHKLKITHRDIKPENIVLQHCNERSTKIIYKIIDLGYAKELSDATISFVGTLHYLAPEIFETVKYDCSVDYWSMGVMTFEIVCGVLPFLPHLPPAQRFLEIQKKSSEDICIYLNYSGQITRSSEIKKEHYISGCLKQDIENWLKHVLQFDPIKRSQPFPENVQVFDYLQKILKKNIVNVFSMHKLEFYSYEFDNSTLVGTLKDWISRDIKSSKNDIILLVENDNFCTKDNQLICDILNENNTVYAIRKDTAINYPLTYNFPKLIKEITRSAAKFQYKYSLQLFIQLVWFLTMEKKICQHTKYSINLLNNHLNSIIKQLKSNIYATSKGILKMLTKIECINSLRNNNPGDKNLNENALYKDYLIYNQRLLSNLERCLNSFQKLEKKTEIIMERYKILQQSWVDVANIIKEYDLEEQYDIVMKLLEITDKGRNLDVFKTKIKDVVSTTLRIKEKTFKNKQFMAYISATLSVTNCTESMLMWNEEFKNHIEQLSESFLKSEIMYRNILMQVKEDNSKKSPSLNSLSGELQNLPAAYLIKENVELRCKFEKVLSRSILAHKKYVISMDEIISDF